MKLYKYRKFSEFLIRELCSSNIYFSDPKLFNDPLDCSPVIINDLKDDELERLCFQMLVKELGEEIALERLENFRYYSQEHLTCEKQKLSYLYQLQSEVMVQLDAVMKNRGVLSLSSKHDSPLMWSHYADEHRGVCIEFDMDSAVRVPKAIDYDSVRGISAKLIHDYFVDGAKSALEQIESQYFFNKAGEWRYESEWRLLSNKCGENPAPFNISAVYFGMRCDNWIIASLIKLLYQHESGLKFYKMYPDRSSFELHESELYPQEWISCIPRPSVAMAFGKVER
ncbi:DUF2971 domain-containing protein [Vibrio alginolyticus]|uniref:DUF2971 domain-containing protein n=1 Tax=Vibrio alginolyticus TaxID=663 RepID=UPI001592AF8E|nr:DUF2971 domain-containing protein [Vibrio alginolyticus]QKS94353.1 DUF2971 domain-containing protein [Vibrio alginolyticus]HCZ9033973.1 DUF2971 domain-containing protein [Vibrio alginolyticus]HCZ9053034.1 DUF2971 domain-containing protein [Vibrio alginolyticus]